MKTPCTLRVCYLTLEPFREGHASYTHVFEVVDALNRRGMHVEILRPGYPHGGRRPGALERLVRMSVVQLRAVLGGRPDVLFLRWHFAALPIAVLAWLGRVPVVVEVNGPYEDLFIAWPWTRRFSVLFKWIMRIQLRRAVVVLAVTPGLSELVRAETAESALPRVEVVSNGANTELFRPDLPRPPGLPKRYAIFFGTMAQWQGIATMLRAVTDIAWPAEIALVFAGDGPLRERVSRAAATDDRVIDLGILAYQKLAPVVANAVVGLVPAENIGGRGKTGLAPLKLFEMMACALPVVVTDLPGQAELVRVNNCGVVMPEGDAHALACAVAQIAGDPDGRRKSGERGRQLVLQSFSWAVISDRIAEVLRDAASQRRCRAT